MDIICFPVKLQLNIFAELIGYIIIVCIYCIDNNGFIALDDYSAVFSTPIVADQRNLANGNIKGIYVKFKNLFIINQKS